ncbi:uncharacterized protein EDB91DRAFT_1178592 [Suillus paluster]|uniref:uncharacterized protein n=1 Tax=Suillus paluster TaxID=48578 RepID=UPI001B8684BA|nr:uncharacterized protein EDB91DRAFT_1178592 [Suillus paluster]KAG1720120.1 hypothetical protein EDB91DRAFT_1178592 [Suillus paluster]
MAPVLLSLPEVQWVALRNINLRLQKCLDILLNKMYALLSELKRVVVDLVRRSVKAK